MCCGEDGTVAFAAVLFNTMDIVMSEYLKTFMDRTREDPRMGATHISLYVALHHLWQIRGGQHPISVFSHEVMPYCKISGPATYHRCIRQLQEYGYIRYVPSYNHFMGSLVWVG